ncbi:helix-turn-helix domain-containing protein [Paenibacillus sp. IHBB 10380]|uniref:helix-turn-helix domain-containing protein n=1 Tax=Paenibacillus sp. IHBB 10380 TaxID=1566358 RepID=UPI0040407855
MISVVSLGDRIRSIRKNKMLNQTEFSLMIGISQGTLSELERAGFCLEMKCLLILKHLKYSLVKVNPLY